MVDFFYFSQCFFILCQNVNFKFPKISKLVFLFSENHSPEFENEDFHKDVN